MWNEENIGHIIRGELVTTSFPADKTCLKLAIKTLEQAVKYVQS